MFFPSKQNPLKASKIAPVYFPHLFPVTSLDSEQSLGDRASLFVAACASVEVSDASAATSE